MLRQWNKAIRIKAIQFDRTQETSILLNSKILLAVVFVVGCQNVEPTRQLGILSFAVIGEHVLAGRAVTFGEDGTFNLNSLNSDLSCLGRFRAGTPSTGRLSYKCSNGMKGKLRFEVEGMGVGSGKGNTDLGPVQLVFGYRIDQANFLLDLPEDIELAVDENNVVVLQSRNPPLEPDQKSS